MLRWVESIMIHHLPHLLIVINVGGHSGTLSLFNLIYSAWVTARGCVILRNKVHLCSSVRVTGVG